jgi:predicted nucleic acid-binding protein
MSRLSNTTQSSWSRKRRVAEVWVVNASPIIALAQVEALDLLTRLAAEVLVPQAVVAEVCAGPPDDPARRALERGWGARAPHTDVPASVLEWSLGQGESAVLATALARTGSTAILDDAEARACARVLGVHVLGSLGIVLRAKRNGLIPSAAGLIRRLREVGLFIDDVTIANALQSATGERWP